VGFEPSDHISGRGSRVDLFFHAQLSDALIYASHSSLAGFLFESSPKFDGFGHLPGVFSSSDLAVAFSQVGD
jgi:hypothetical protein